MCKIFCNFAADFEKRVYFIKSLLKYLGVFVLLLGVVCLVVYKFALPENGLLIASIVLEVVGVLSYIFINKAID